ncbi:MAG: glycosyltransferase family 39 protein [Planctomycetaceae bacterium]|nr:glycosyltransferase family 39 protein [Planctomycetaceae bacterium]
MTQPRRYSILLLLMLFLAGGLRLGLVFFQSDQLQQDRDAYIAIAENLAAGNGYSSSNRNLETEIRPTAFRPPLYPCLLSVIYYLKAGSIGVGVMQIILGILTVWFTWKIGTQLQMGGTALIAAAIVATDPMLLQYTTYAMTEVLAAFLTSLLLFLLVTCLCEQPATTETTTRNPLAFWTGIVWGLAILCRPTYLAFFGIWLVFQCASGLVLRLRRFKTESVKQLETRQLAVMAAGILLAVSPWVMRNLLVFQSPILSTTHGGYTLLLGNNPVFYKEVVQKQWGTVWSGESLDAWQKNLEQEIAQAEPPIKTEQERDRWMYERAKQNIARQPDLFVQACLLRLKRFWNISPLLSSSVTAHPVIDWGIAGYYTTILIGCLGGVFLVIWNSEKKWEPLIWLLFSFTLVHLVYWTNMRMRAPLVPAIALLSVYGWSQMARFLKFGAAADGPVANRHKE